MKSSVPFLYLSCCPKKVEMHRPLTLPSEWPEPIGSPHRLLPLIWRDIYARAGVNEGCHRATSKWGSRNRTFLWFWDTGKYCLQRGYGRVGVAATPQSQHPEGRNRCSSVSSKPVWSTQHIQASHRTDIACLKKQTNKNAKTQNKTKNGGGEWKHHIDDYLFIQRIVIRESFL